MKISKAEVEYHHSKKTITLLYDSMGVSVLSFLFYDYGSGDDNANNDDNVMMRRRMDNDNNDDNDKDDDTKNN